MAVSNSVGSNGLDQRTSLARNPTRARHCPHLVPRAALGTPSRTWYPEPHLVPRAALGNPEPNSMNRTATDLDRNHQRRRSCGLKVDHHGLSLLVGPLLLTRGN